MTPHQILIVAIRILAIFCFVSVLGRIAAAIVTMEQLGVTALSIWVAAGIELGVCVYLWLFPATLAAKLLRDGHSVVSVGSVPFTEWRDLLFVAVGLLVLAGSIPKAVYWAILAGASEPFAQDVTLEQKVSAGAAFLELAIGVGLVLGARGLGSLLQKIRAAGSTES